MKKFGPAMVLMGVLPALAAEPGFTAPVKVTRDAAGARIEFKAASPTDCAVSILDAKGKVVRHLAAGVLGKNAPPPLQKGSLAQTLGWDGKDDFGKPASGGPFQAQVALGLKPQFDKIIGANPAALGQVRGLATGPRGELYVFHVFGALHPSDGTAICSVFSRDGKYLRTIMPYPANLPEEKTKGLKQIDLGNGVKVPYLYQAETRSLVPGAGDLPPQRAVAARDGRVAFVGIQEGPHRYAGSGIAQVVLLHADGSVPANGVLRAKLTDSSGDRAASLALSPDQKTLYAADVLHGKKREPTQVVYRFGWDDKQALPFLGTLGKAGNDDKHFNDPRSVAVDKDGNIYVADKGNNRIAVFNRDGKGLGSLAVDKPERVEVNAKNGAVYVLGGASVNLLQKFVSWKQGQPAVQLKLPFFKHPRYTAVMALDDSAQPPVLWVGQPFEPQYARFGVLRVEDRGNAFGKPVDLAQLAGGPPHVGPVFDLSIDRQGGLLYIDRQWRYDVAGGKLAKINLRVNASHRQSGAVGLDGNVYWYGFPDLLFRYGPDLKPLPFTENSGKLGALRCGGNSRVRGRGVTADRQGNIYVLVQKYVTEPGVDPNPDKVAPGDARDANRVDLYMPDGKLKKRGLIDSEIRSLNSIRLDYAGNIYLALGLRPGKDLLPPGLQGKVAEGSKDPDSVGQVNSYPLIYGSIVKFGPDGGIIRKDSGGVSCNYAYGTPTAVQGARWIFSGASNVPSWRTKGTPDICLCESPRFDVDGFGRSFFPDAGRFRIGVLDTAGNELAWFGSYGNPDSNGFFWPYAVAVDDDAIYIGDRLNRRVVRVRLAYRAEQVGKVP